jgi:indolepyruvate ferredoxin oxidoreductase
MTGGQPMDGPLDPAMVTRQLYAEGVSRIVVVSDEPDKYPVGTEWAPDVELRHRDDLDRVQRDLRDFPGVTALVYDQTCAAEKRRRRKRGRYPDPAKRVVINELVCEGCGDCSIQSNCLSVVPLETEFGRKRRIDQSSCNKDFSCLKGFCPSFVTVHGGRPRRPAPAAAAVGAARTAAVPEPSPPDLDGPYGILVTGVGGTGVVTIGALLGVAAHLEGKGCTVLDMTGLAQKGGAVTSHVRLAPTPEDLHAVRISAGGARLLLGCDLVVSAGFDALSKVRQGVTRVVINAQETITGDFTRNPDLVFPERRLREMILAAAGDAATDFLPATRLATALIGDSIATNLFMLGYAWQSGAVPLSRAAIERAIELNGTAVEANLSAFHWGRRAAHDRGAVEAAAETGEAPDDRRLSSNLDEAIARRVDFLTAYQDSGYAARYRALVERARDAEARLAPGLAGFAEAVARSYFKLLAYKDEYEVARLYTDGSFLSELRGQFEGDYRLRLHLAPPLLARRDPESGHLQKREYRAWVLTAMRGLAALRRLRGTPFDVFGYTAERRRERRAIGDYEALVGELLPALTPETHEIAVELATLPQSVRGFGHIKEANRVAAEARAADLRAALSMRHVRRAAAQ